MVKQTAIALVAVTATSIYIVHLGLDRFAKHALPAAAAGQCYAFELAAERFKKNNERWPSGDSHSEIVHLLMGDKHAPGSDKIDYLLLTSSEENVPLHVSETPKGSGRYVALDVWNNPLNFSVTDDGFKAVSNGPDGKPGTPDDISAADHQIAETDG